MAPQLQDFLGHWRLSRQIVPAEGAPARFAGQAVFTPAGAGLCYHETGLLHLEHGPPMQAGRRYLWHAEGGEIVVRFADERPFHRFCPTAPQASHFCAPDTYRVAYDFAHWPLWLARWQVKGPRKDYEMISRYER